jgi:hypothetical protein
VELGYNLQLQKKEDAKIYYDQAIVRLKKTQMKFTVSPVHSKKSIIRLCFEIHQIASDLEPKYNFNYQKAYGQLGNTE